MRVKTRLRANVAVLLILGGSALPLFFLGYDRVRRAAEAQDVANEIVVTSFEGLALRSDFALTNSARARAQWSVNQKRLERLLQSAAERFRGSESRAALEALSKGHASSGRLFQALVEHRGSAVRGAAPTDLATELENRLVNQLNGKAYDTLLHARQLRAAARAEMFSTLKRAGWTLFGVFIVMIGVAAANAWTVGRMIGERFARLQEGIAIISGGDLGHTIDVRGDDELAGLSEAFNAMTARLHASYGALEREAAVRQAAEGEVRKLNAELSQKVQELEAANRELERFGYSVSHDLRTPLRQVTAFVSLLQKGLGDRVDDRSRYYMERIVRSAQTMAALIDDLLSFSRVSQAGMQRETVGMAPLVAEVIRETQGQAEGREVRWEIGDLPEVLGDRAMLRLVLVNLLSNAVKYTRPRLRAEIRVGCREEEGEYVFFVQDNGVGFDMQCADRLFGVFERLHPVAQFEGTGIGLANVRTIISRHGGKTWAEGQVDRGATFFFTLPKAPQRRCDL